MGYCPKCGAKVYSDELFCISCGEELPHNLSDRLLIKKWRLKHFLIPILLMILMIGSTATIYIFSQLKVNQAKILYDQAEEALLLNDHDSANKLAKKAVEQHPSFEQANTLHEFTRFSVETLNNLTNAELKQDQLQRILQAKQELSHYNGEAVNQFQDYLLNRQKEIQLNSVKKRLTENPPIADLPALLWEADSIKDPEAYDLVRSIREQLITHATNQAYDLLANKQFSLAQSMVENGLLYSPNDQKLSSLLSSIEKEKTAFEAAQEARLEQAFSHYEAEQLINENDAIEDLSIDFKIDNHSQLLVSGEITSVATVPIHAILVHYTLFDENDLEIDSNEIFVYPETLYPGETGQFDHIHFDEQVIEKTNDVQVISITWLLN